MGHFLHENLSIKAIILAIFKNFQSYLQHVVLARPQGTYSELLTTLTYPGNKSVTYTYDELHRLKTVTNGLNQKAIYNYDAAGDFFNKTKNSIR